MKTDKKILLLKDLPKIKKTSRKKITLVGGTFDFLHSAHLKFLEECKHADTLLVVGIDSDKKVRTRKGNSRPIFPQKYRARMLAALELVDYVFITGDSAYGEQSVRLLRPDIIIFALEGNTKLYRKKYKAEFEKRYPWLKVQFTNTRPGVSTTTIIKDIVQKCG